MTTTQAREFFTVNLPACEDIARTHFRGLRAEARAEALQNATALAWKYWDQLTTQRPDADPELIRSVWWNAIRHHKAGRTIIRTQTERPSPGGDTMDRAPRDRSPIEHATHNQSIPNVVALRIDFPIYLATLTRKDRGIAHDLAGGMSPADVARKRHVTPAAISQFRTRASRLYRDFHTQTA